MFKAAARIIQFVTSWRAAYLLTVIVSALVYLPSMSGLPIWDDHALIAGYGIGGGKSLGACFTEPFLSHYFRPLVSVTFLLDHKAFGPGPFFYHQTNLVIHVVTTILCLALFHAAFRCRWIAVIGALVFALQPAQVSTVAWIGGRTDSLCTMWLCLFSWSLIRSAQTLGRPRIAWTAVSALAFGLALLTKEQALSMLPLVPLAYRCFATAPSDFNWRSSLLRSLPFAAAGFAFVVAWVAFYPSPHPPVLHGLSGQLALAGRSLTYYFGLLSIPTPASMHLLSVGRLERWGVWSVLIGYAALGTITLYCVRNLRRNPGAAWFCAFVILGMLPVSNLIPLPSLVVAPYRVGVCGPGAAALIACALADLYRRAIRSRNRSVEAQAPGRPVSSLRVTAPGLSAVLCTAAGALLLCWYGGLTFWGAGCWQDELSVFTKFVQYDPDSIVARFNLTTALLKQHRSGPALIELDRLMTRLFASRDWEDQKTAEAALERDPGILTRIRENQGNSIRPESWLAALYGQRGFGLLEARDREGARRSFATGLAIDRTNDDVNLGIAQMNYEAGEYRSTIGCLRIVLATRPKRAEARMLLGHTLAAMGRWREAQAELEAWAAIEPWSGQAHMEVAQAQCRLGNFAGARASLQYALSSSICNVEEVRARLRDLHGRAAQITD